MMFFNLKLAINWLLEAMDGYWLHVYVGEVAASDAHDWDSLAYSN